MSGININEWLRIKRITNGLTLRKFCLATGADSVFWSDLERGRGPLPAEDDFYKILKTTLNLNEEEYLFLLKHKPPLVHKKKVF